MRRSIHQALVNSTLPLGLILSAAAQAQGQQAVSLLNKKDLSGWTFHLAEPGVKMNEVWSNVDGVLTCIGKPAGYLITKKNDFHDYVLTLQWRWHTGRGGNNGVLVHCSKPGVLGVWCQSVEVQLEHGNAGDFWVIGTELDVDDEATRREGRRHKNLTDNAEKPLGEWNDMEIICRSDEIIVKVNGQLVNHATQVSETEGAIALQSEGTPIQYRRIVLKPLP